RVWRVCVPQDDLRLVRDVPSLARDGRAGEVSRLSVPPEPHGRCVGTILGRGSRDPDLTHALQPPIDVAPRDVAAQGLHAYARTLHPLPAISLVPIAWTFTPAVRRDRVSATRCTYAYVLGR